MNPGCVDNPGGGDVQKREAFRQIWPRAKVNLTEIVFHLPGIPPLPAESTLPVSSHKVLPVILCGAQKKLKMLPVLAAVHFKIGIKAVS